MGDTAAGLRELESTFALRVIPGLRFPVGADDDHGGVMQDTVRGLSGLMQDFILVEFPGEGARDQKLGLTARARAPRGRR